MSIPTKLWIYACAAISLLLIGFGYGYHIADASWSLRAAERKLADAEASHKLSEEYRLKEKKLNETIGEIETRAINDAANTEMEYKAVMDRLRDVSANAANGWRIKPALTCRTVPNNPASASNGNEEVQSGLSIEAAGRIIGVGAECDKIVASLDACQSYAKSLQQDKEKPLD